MECTSQSTPATVRIENVDVPVFTDRADVHETDFMEVWMHWFANDRTGFMEEEAVFALNEITTYLCVENASGIALSVTAELYATLYALACMQTKTTHPFFFFFFFFSHGIGNTFRWNYFRGIGVAIVY